MWGAKPTTTDPLNYYRTSMLDNAWMAGITQQRLVHLSPWSLMGFCPDQKIESSKLHQRMISLQVSATNQIEENGLLWPSDH